jgi:hypothetical protein
MPCIAVSKRESKMDVYEMVKGSEYAAMEKYLGFDSNSRKLVPLYKCQFLICKREITNIYFSK